MSARIVSQGLSAALLAFWAMGAGTGSASAQGYPFDYGWGARRPSVEVAPPDDDRYGDPDDDRYDPRYDRRDPPEQDQGYGGRADRPYGGPREETNRDDSARDERAPDGPRYADPRYEDRFNEGPRLGDRRYDDRGDYGDWWDSAPPPGEEERLSKTPGVDGGPRPVIAPVAPPRVAFSGPYAPGSIVIDTSARKLYYVVNASSAYAYSIGVGRQGFAWTGKEKVSRISDWPDWYPPADMRRRKPELPERMLGGIRNPLGAKAIYLGNTLYRIHGTNDPKSIGKAESSGCFRMLNANVLHLASLVHVGTEVTIVRSLKGRNIASAAKPAAKSAEPRANESAPPPRRYPRDEDAYVDDGWH